MLSASGQSGFAQPPADSPPSTGTSRALLIVGLPGDDEHRELFDNTIKAWHEWLTRMHFAADDIAVLVGDAETVKAPSGWNLTTTTNTADGPIVRGPASRAAIEEAVADLKKRLAPADRLWIMYLGHASHDGRHAWLHLLGADLNEADFAALFKDVRCDEQVFWLTSAASGWFVPDLAAPGRIVVAATERDREFNETEFPQALATVASRPIRDLDTNGDNMLSILEIFAHTVDEVKARFAADQRIVTEHAQLDDNGDGTGSETPAAKPDGEAGDGILAASTYLPLAPGVGDPAGP